jgi:hypothetical protein
MNTYTQNIKINRPPDPRVYQNSFPSRVLNVPAPGMPYEQPKLYAPKGLNTNEDFSL